MIVVVMPVSIPTTIINGACGIGINAGHRTSNWHVRITLGSRVLRCYTVRTCTYDVRTGACMYSITLHYPFPLKTEIN